MGALPAWGGINKANLKAFQRRKSQAPPHGQVLPARREEGPAIKGLLKAFPWAGQKSGPRRVYQVTHGKVLPPHMGTILVPRARGARRKARRSKGQDLGESPNCLIEPLVVLAFLLAFPCGTLILVRLITWFHSYTLRLPTTRTSRQRSTSGQRVNGSLMTAREAPRITKTLTQTQTERQPETINEQGNHKRSQTDN